MEEDGDDEVQHHEKISVIADVETATEYEQPAEEAAEAAEAVQFEEPIDLSEYDEFTLSKVVQRKLAAVSDGSTRVTAPKETKAQGSIESLTAHIKFEEDEADIRLAEAMKASTMQKLQDAMGAADLDAKPEEPRARVLQSWADVTQLPLSDYEALRPDMALSYPFELDTFQKQAVCRLERHEHVFVSAHTSAGKTVVAEYAIALALKHGSRAVYTSPIKALSNQKYRDFKERFGVENVGIVTGDVSVNPQAQCLIMTTEIFRSMLYKGADTVRDIEYVVFDEVHYVNDAERGVVWEEVIIMLPETICLIFLSATTPNAVDFSDWIGRTKRKKVYLMSTNKRPVPLQHFMFFEDEAFKLLTGDKQYNPAALPAAVKLLKDKSQPKPMTAENAKFASQRAGEKAAIAAQRAGNDPKARQAAMQQSLARNSKAGGGSSAKNTGNMPGKSSAVGGSKMQWLSLLSVLQAGGREARGGQLAIDFGVATNNRTVILDKMARQEKDDMVAYEKLPNYIRASLSKKEYESMEVRGSEQDPESGASNEIGLLPVVIFSFSKKKCEELADYFKSQDLLTNREKGRVQTVVAGVLQRLSPLDAELPQITRLREMLCRGIGVHHSGLLPILKETVELLFAQGSVKVLLATETFAMGVNMPARAVVFNGYRKHDGRQFRDLYPGEYIQMAGRAGRRGLDKVGTVIIAIWGELPTELNIRKLLIGQPTLLSSQFRLRYNMILNLVRADTLSIEDMMKRSFTEFSAQKTLAGHDLHYKRKKYELLMEYLEQMQAQYPADGAEDLINYAHYFQTCKDLLSDELALIDQILLAARAASSIDHVLCAGRLLHVHNQLTGQPVQAIVLTSPSAHERLSGSASAPVTPTGSAKGGESDMAAARAALMGGSAKLPAHSSATSSSNGKVTADTAKVSVLALLDGADLPEGCDAAAVNHLQSVKLDAPFAADGTYGFVLVDGRQQFFLLMDITVKDIGIIYDSIAALPLQYNELSITHLVASATKKREKTLELLDLMRVQKNAVSSHLDVADLQHKQVYHAQLVLGNYLPLAYPCMSRRFLNYHKMQRVHSKLAMIKHAISSASISLFPEFRQRRNVLAMLGYVQPVGAAGEGAFASSVFEAAKPDDHHVITKKGRVCCELNSCDELLGTEMLFHNVLEPLNPPEVAGILSALVFQEKNDVEETLTSRMEVARQQIMEIFHQLNTLQGTEAIEVDPEQSGMKPVVNFGLCSVVYQWARGVAFKDITAITSFQEGSIVRAITRLDELCRDIQKAARMMGNASLYYKMEAVSACIKRDIVFAASLYIT